jgi:uncharacterized membrane protein YqaE (UPF0057 family)
MRYLLAFLIPPLAVLLCKRPGQFIINLVIWLISIPAIFFLGIGLIGWLICTIHALSVCKVSSIDKRVDRVVRAIEKRSETPQRA